MRYRLDTGVLDLDSRRLTGPDGKITTLSPMEGRLLAWLAARPTEIVGQDELLREVWGYGATVESRTVRTTLNRLRNKIERDPSEPRHLLTEHGFGYRFVAPPDRPAAGELTIGRDAELAHLARADGWLVAVTGPGGVGKTHLARRFVADGEARWVDASDTLAHRIVASVGREAHDVLPAAERAIADHPVRWVLDDLDPAGVLVLAALHAAVPSARFLVTARARTGLPGEQVLPLAPLPPAVGARLLVERARMRDLALALDPADPVILALATRLDGLPIALELAAAMLDLLEPAALLERLTARGLAALPEAQRVLRATFEEAWARSSPADREALVAMASFAGPVPIALAEELVGSLAAIRQLVDASLVLRPGPGQLAMLAVLRPFALEHAPPGLALRHAEVVVARAESLAGPIRERIAGIRELWAELWSAHRRAEGELAVRVARVLDPVLALHGPFDAHVALFEATAAVAPDRPWVEAGRARARGLAGKIAEAAAIAEAGLRRWPDDRDLTLELARCRLLQRRYAEATALFRSCGSARGEAAAVRAFGRLEEAEALLRGAIPELDEVERIAVLADLGELLSDLGNHEEAAQTLIGAVRLAEEAGSGRQRAIALMRLGAVRIAEGELDRAVSALQEARAAYVVAGDARGELITLWRLDQVAIARGDHPAAERLLAEARAHERRTLSLGPWLDVHEALLRVDQGRLGEARPLFDRICAAMAEEDSLDRDSIFLLATWVPLLAGDDDLARDRLRAIVARATASRLVAEASLLLVLVTRGDEAAAHLARGRSLGGGEDPELAALAAVVRGDEIPAEWTRRSLAVRLAARRSGGSAQLRGT